MLVMVSSRLWASSMMTMLFFRLRPEMRKLPGLTGLTDNFPTESSPGTGVEESVVGENYELGQRYCRPGGVVRTAGGSPAGSDEVLDVVDRHHGLVS